MSVINTNITSMIGQQNLNASKSELTTSMERLSSGLRINSAKDDAAGQAIANRMSSQITGLSQAQRNANDGISVAQTAEGAANQVNDNLQRIRELTVQASNGTNSDEDLASIQNEIGQRLDEIDRISEETSFNGVDVLAQDRTLKIQVGSEDGQSIEIDLKKLDRDTLNLASFDVTKMVDTEMLSGSVTSVDVADIDTVGISADSNGGTETEDGLYALADGSGYVVKGSSGDYYTADTTDATAVTWNSSSTAVAAGDVDVAGGAVTEIDPGTTTATPVTGLAADGSETLLEKQDSEGVGTGEYVVKTVTTDATTGEETVSYNKAEMTDGAVTKGDALTGDPLKSLDSALSTVDNLRSDLGAIQNRFDSAITNLSTTETNLSAARSRIEDADYAVEVANMTRAQILQQAGTSVLAQANQVPQSVLSLLG